MEKALVYAKHKNARTSVKKATPLITIVRGKNVAEAKRILQFDKTKVSNLILETLNSAVANARHNLSLSEDNLYVSEIYANEGPTFHRARFIGRIRVNPISKRTATLVVGLSERKKA